MYFASHSNITGLKVYSSILKVVKKFSGVSADSNAGSSGESEQQTPEDGEAKLPNGKRQPKMASIMSKLKGGGKPPPLESNPIMQYFEVGRECTTAGIGLLWRVHDAYRKSDGKECSVFVFDKRAAEKIMRFKRKDTMLERVRWTINALDKLRHPKMLQVIHQLEEGHNTLAFASEPVLSCLHNILTYQEMTMNPSTTIHPYPTKLSPDEPETPEGLEYAKEYFFLDIEIRYGLLQIIEALNYMHYTAKQIHRNICPQVIIVCKRGTWKLFGLEFIEKITSQDPTEMVNVSPWSIKFTKVFQPSLDFMGNSERIMNPCRSQFLFVAGIDSLDLNLKLYVLSDTITAPEIQTHGQCNILSDMFSLGMVIAAIFNNGKPLIQANYNPLLYMKQMEFLDDQVMALLPRIPAALQEAVTRLLSRDPHPRPTTQLLPLIKYFNRTQGEPAIQALQFLDVITMKDNNQKSHFYVGTLIDALPYIPKKLRWQHVWPALQMETKSVEVLASVLHPIIWLINECTPDEFAKYVLPTLKQMYARNFVQSPKTMQACIVFLENLHIILRKCARAEANNEMIPIMIAALNHNNNSVQTASLIALQNCSDYIDDQTLQTVVLGKVRTVLERNYCDIKIISLILCFYEKVLMRLERNQLLEHVIPTILIMRLNDPDIITRVVKLYKAMILEKKFGLSTNVMAQKMLPSLAPQTVNPSLNVDQFTNLMEILYDMLDNIDKHQRIIMNGPKPPNQENDKHRSLRHQMSTDNVVAPPFNIPNLRVEQRKTSSAEDMARKNSVPGPTVASATTSQSSVGGGFKKIGQWFFGSNNSTNSNNDNNFLRVANVFPNRRLSDNTLMTPKIRIAPSCASSPGGTPGSTAGLPTRRHSSIGPQERRSSNTNLSPPTVNSRGYQFRGRGGSGSSLSVPSASQCAGGSMPNTSSSVPFLLSSSMQSIRSRRPSACMSGAGSQGSGLLQQISSGVVRHLPSRLQPGGSGAGPSHATPGGSHSSVHSHGPQWSFSNATAAGYNALHHTAMAVRKCPSLNITLTR